MDMDRAHIDRLSKSLIDQINAKLPHVIKNGEPEQTYPGEAST